MSGLIRKRPDGSHTCYYDDIESVPNVHCRGDLTFVVHDKRGCHLVCQAHAEWRAAKSSIQGHGADCPNWFDVGYKWKPVTVV